MKSNVLKVVCYKLNNCVNVLTNTDVNLNSTLS